MYISSATIHQFRGIKSATASFNDGFNLIVGPNDSGKTTFIDAIRIALGTRTDERISVLDTDIRGGALPRFDLTIKFTDIKKEGRWFTEYLTPLDDGGFQLNIYCVTESSSSGFYFQRRLAGPSFELAKELSASVLDHLRATYLKPIRDASLDLGSSQYSRLARILKAHTKVESNKDKLFDEYKKASDEINKIFGASGGAEGVLYRPTTKTVQDHFNSFSEKPDIEETRIGFKNPDVRTQKYLRSILQKLDIWTDGNLPGLGTANTLYMAAELMLIDDIESDNLKLALVEELEAHIHPTRQLKIVQSLQRLCDEDGTQIIATSHSPNLASKVRIENLLLCHSGFLFDFSEAATSLSSEEGDYKYLERFLDVTKSSIFFSRGNILVEGTTEQFLVPAFAEVLGHNLVDYGASVINVSHLAFKRFTKAFTRKGNESNHIPIAVITDADKKKKARIDNDLRQNNDTKNNIGWHYGLTVEDEPIKSAATSETNERATFEKLILAKNGALAALYKKAYKKYHNGDKEKDYEDEDESEKELSSDYMTAYGELEKIKAPIAQMVSIYILDILASSNDGAQDQVSDQDPSLEALEQEIRELFPNIVNAIDQVTQSISPEKADVSSTDNEQ